MTKDFRSSDTAETPALGQGFVACKAIKKTGGKKITGTGRVNDTFNRFSIDHVNLVGAGDHAPLFTACQGSQPAFAADQLQGIIELFHLVPNVGVEED